MNAPFKDEEQSSAVIIKPEQKGEWRREKNPVAKIPLHFC